MAALSLRNLLPHTTCPYCWHEFAPADVLFLSAHEDLRGDPRLGPDEMLRFRPSRFNLKGHALDARGLPCQRLACPHCHLPIPEALLSTQPMFMSIMGTPGCGKSFFLGAMTWELRRVLPEQFALKFTDADPTFNTMLNSYENSLFIREQDVGPVPLGSLIPKTEEKGIAGLYAPVSFGNQIINYPRPFLFLLSPGEKHPATDPARLSRVLCVYDNAGEAFQPGGDSTALPTTQHLGKSQVLLFLFDPTQHPRFRALYKSVSGKDMPSSVPTRQDIVLREAAARIRRLLMLDTNHRYHKPLIVVVTKYDSWKELLPEAGEEPFLTSGGVSCLDREAIRNRSAALRRILEQTCNEVVQAADEFAGQVYFLPASPLGQRPVFNQQYQSWCLAPGPIQPVGVTTPFLLGLHLSVSSLVSTGKKSSTKGSVGSSGSQPGSRQGRKS